MVRSWPQGNSSCAGNSNRQKVASAGRTAMRVPQILCDQPYPDLMKARGHGILTLKRSWRMLGCMALSHAGQAASQ
jgi:hypothetical protein